MTHDVMSPCDIRLMPTWMWVVGAIIFLISIQGTLGASYNASHGVAQTTTGDSYVFVGVTFYANATGNISEIWAADGDAQDRCNVWNNDTLAWVGTNGTVSSGVCRKNFSITAGGHYMVVFGPSTGHPNMRYGNGLSSTVVTAVGNITSGVYCNAGVAVADCSASEGYDTYARSVSSFIFVTDEASPPAAVNDTLSYSNQSNNGRLPLKNTTVSITLQAAGAGTMNLSNVTIGLDNGEGTLTNRTTTTLTTNTTVYSYSFVSNATMGKLVRWQFYFSAKNATNALWNASLVYNFTTSSTPNGTLNFTNLTNKWVELNDTGDNKWNWIVDGAEFDMWMEANPDGTCSVHGYEHKGTAWWSSGTHLMVYFNGTNMTNIRFAANTTITTARTMGLARDQFYNPLINGSYHLFITDWAGTKVYHYKTGSTKTDFSNACGSSAVLSTLFVNHAPFYDVNTRNWTLITEESSNGTRWYSSSDGCSFNYGGRITNGINATVLNGTDPSISMDNYGGNNVYNFLSTEWTNPGDVGTIAWRQGTTLNTTMTVKNANVVPTTVGVGVAPAGQALIRTPTACKSQSAYDFYLAILDDNAVGYYGHPLILVDADNRTYYQAFDVQPYDDEITIGQWVSPTPGNMTNTSTQVTLNASCSKGYSMIYFGGSTNPPQVAAGIDLNSDGTINGSDVTLLNTVILGAACPSYCDLNNDSAVNALDSQLLLNYVTNGYTTSMTIGTYYFDGECRTTTHTSGRFGEYVITYDTNTPVIRIGANNQFNAQNYSLRNQYGLNLTLDLNFSAKNALSTYAINISKGGVTYYNFTNISIGTNATTYNRLVDRSNWTAGRYNITISVNDTAGNAKSERYDFYLGNYSTTSPTGYANETATFTINLTSDSSNSFNGTLYYNGTPHAGIVTGTIITSSFLLGNDGSFDYYWTITDTQNDGNTTVFNTTTASHTADAWTMYAQNCGTNLSMQLQLRDENTPANNLSATWDFTMRYWILNKSNAKDYNDSVNSSTSYFQVCIYPTTGTIYADIYATQSAPGGYTHRFILQNHSFDGTVQYQNVYNWNNTGASDLKVTTRNANTYAYMTNIVGVLQRYYVAEGLWRSVQWDRTGDYGLLFYNIREEDTDYRLLYYDENNNLLKQTQSLKFVCTAGVCDIIQLLTPYTAATNASNSTAGYTFDNTTRILTITWQSYSGSTTANLSVRRQTIAGTHQVCSVEQTGTSGSTQCNLSIYTGSVEARAVVGNITRLNALYDLPKQKLGSILGKTESGLVTFGIMVTIAGFGLFSPVGLLILTSAGLILIFFLGAFTPLTGGFIIITAIVTLVLGVKMKT